MRVRSKYWTALLSLESIGSAWTDWADDTDRHKSNLFHPLNPSLIFPVVADGVDSRVDEIATLRC